jgi:glycosyltransferase involved in cell wall biosynthesis/nucleotide-binding universal stress UspA family protein
MSDGVRRGGISSDSRRKRRILLPIFNTLPNDHLIPLARALQEDQTITILGIVPVDENRSLSEAASEVREFRTFLRREVASQGVRVWPKIFASHSPDYEIAAFAASNNVDLILLPWFGDDRKHNAIARKVLSYSPCNVAVVKGHPIKEKGNLLAVLRAGPHSLLALRLALAMTHSMEYSITSLRPATTSQTDTEAQADLAMDQVMQYLPQVERSMIADSILISDDPTSIVLEESKEYDLIILGVTNQDASSQDMLDPLSRTLLEHSRSPLILTRSEELLTDLPINHYLGLDAISILVDKWFAENTFHADEFKNLKRLVERKEQKNLTISLALPALDEEETVGNVIRTIQRALVEEVPLLDEIVLIDSNSTDHTREIAESLGIPVFIHQQILPQYGARSGKGEALWKSLYVTKGDLILWIDTDIVNIHPRFIYGLIGPLLQRPDLMYVKGFYLRPIKVGNVYQAGGGGRVTELTTRPLLNLFYPSLSGIIQPLSGEYGGRREALERVPFSSGYGVETGLLIDILEWYGIGSIGQVDLIERIHHNQPLAALSKMSFAIIQTLIRKLDRRYGLQLLKDINRSMKLIRRKNNRFSLDVEEIAELERPPIITLPEYQAKWESHIPTTNHAK